MSIIIVLFIAENHWGNAVAEFDFDIASIKSIKGVGHKAGRETDLTFFFHFGFNSGVVFAEFRSERFN